MLKYTYINNKNYRYMTNKKFSFKELKEQTEETLHENSRKHSLTFNFAVVLAITIMLSGFLRLTHDAIVYQHPFWDFLKINAASAADVSPNQSQLIEQSHTEVNIKPNTGFTFTLKYKNVGTSTWSKNSTYLKSLSSALTFRHKVWPDPYFPATLKEATVAPGQIGTFVFALQSPGKFGSYTGDFLLVNNNVMIFGGDTKVTMNVVEDPSKIVKVVPTEESNGPKVCTLNLRMENAIDPSDIPASASCIEKFQLPANGPLIRVGLFYLGSQFFPDKSVSLVNDHDWEILDADNNLLAPIAAGTSINIYYNEGKAEYSFDLVDQTIRTKKYLKFNNVNDGMWTINNYEYRPSYSKKINYNDYIGDLELRHNDCSLKDWGSCEDKVWMIEELPMETYLKGIQETSNSDPIEYLKTMAVAARTYAMYHYDRNSKHKWEFYQVDSRFDQVYKGYVSMYLVPNVGVAVDATTGIVATYDSKIIVAPYFSHSDGRTRSYLEVWKQDVPYLISKAAPYSEGKEMYGHGVGIDAYDALKRARNDGFTCDQLLKYYYTGIDLERVY